MHVSRGRNRRTSRRTIGSPGRPAATSNKTAKLEAKLAFLRQLVKAMADAGVELVAGTDAPAVPGLLPGFSLHDDLDELEASGLTRFQALSGRDT